MPLAVMGKVKMCFKANGLIYALCEHKVSIGEPIALHMNDSRAKYFITASFGFH